jgi:hypothetical protein
MSNTWSGNDAISFFKKHFNPIEYKYDWDDGAGEASEPVYNSETHFQNN